MRRVGHGGIQAAIATLLRTIVRIAIVAVLRQIHPPPVLLLPIHPHHRLQATDAFLTTIFLVLIPQ